MKIAFKVNFDYEKDLFKLSSNHLGKIYNDLEVLYFFSSSNFPLYSQRNYSNDFLSYVEKIINKKITIIKNKKEYTVKNWWGNLENIEYERSMNDKRHLINHKSELLEINSDYEKSFIFDDSIDCLIDILKNPILHDNLIIKSPVSFSGKSTIVIEKNKYISDIDYRNKINIILNKFISSYGLIIMNKLDRILDFSIGFNNDLNSTYIYQNKINSNFSYSGTVITNKKKNLFDSLLEILQRNNISIDQSATHKAINDLIKIKDNLIKKSEENFWSIDSFLYTQNGNHHFFLAHEINYRKTMSTISFNLQKLLPTNGYGETFIIKNKSKKTFNFLELMTKTKNIQYNHNKKTGLVLMNEDYKNFFLIFISGKNQSHCDHLYKVFLTILNL